MPTRIGRRVAECDAVGYLRSRKLHRFGDIDDSSVPPRPGRLFFENKEAGYLRSRAAPNEKENRSAKRHGLISRTRRPMRGWAGGVGGVGWRELNRPRRPARPSPLGGAREFILPDPNHVPLGVRATAAGFEGGGKLIPHPLCEGEGSARMRMAIRS